MKIRKHCRFYQIHSQLSWAWKKFITLGPVQNKGCQMQNHIPPSFLRHFEEYKNLSGVWGWDGKMGPVAHSLAPGALPSDVKRWSQGTDNRSPIIDSFSCHRPPSILSVVFGDVTFLDTSNMTLHHSNNATWWNRRDGQKPKCVLDISISYYYTCPIRISFKLTQVYVIHEYFYFFIDRMKIVSFVSLFFWVEYRLVLTLYLSNCRYPFIFSVC